MARLPLMVSMIVGMHVPAFSQDGVPTTVDKIIDRNEIVVSYRDASVPFSYLDGDRKPVGYAYDICMGIVDGMRKGLGKPNIALKTVLVTGPNRIPLLLNGTIDLECGSTTNTTERQNQVAFSLTYFVAGNRLLVRKNGGIAGIGDLSGRTVASTSGSTAFKQLVALNAEKKLNINVISGLDLAETFLLLEVGRAQAVFLDDVILNSMASGSKSPGSYEIVGDPLSVEPYAVMFRKNDPKLKSIVDGVLRTMIATKQIVGLYDKWFQKPIPPKSVDLNFPPSELTRRAWSHPSDSAEASAYAPDR